MQNPKPTNDIPMILASEEDLKPDFIVDFKIPEEQMQEYLKYIDALRYATSVALSSMVVIR